MKVFRSVNEKVTIISYLVATSSVKMLLPIVSEISENCLRKLSNANTIALGGTELPAIVSFRAARFPEDFDVKP